VKVRKVTRRGNRTPEEAMLALRESRKRYEGTKAGKNRKKKWMKANRKKMNAYKRDWRRNRKAGANPGARRPEEDR